MTPGEAQSVTDQRLLAGAARVEITPNTAQWLDGFGNRTTPSEGTYLPIFVRALALRHDQTSVLILSAEVLAFASDRVASLKARIRAATGVPEDAIVLAATHTHCAPRVCQMVMPGVVDSDYVESLEDACLEAALGAVTQLAPAQVTASRGRDEQLGVNRRVVTDAGVTMLPNREGPRDPDVDTLWFAQANGTDGSEEALLASLTVIACHPTSMGGPLIGGDYPGFLMREVERQTGGIALFLLGGAGDVRPCFLSEAGSFRQAILAEVREAGERLAEVALQGRETARRLTASVLGVARVWMDAPLETPPELAEWKRQAANDPNPLTRQWATRMLEQNPRESIPFELQAVSLGDDLTLLCWPGEIASSYALWAKQTVENTGVTQPGLLVAAYCNGAVGYVSTREMYPYGGYEVRGSHIYYGLPAAYAPEVDETLRETTLALLEQLNTNKST